jgi:hypothetical protein
MIFGDNCCKTGLVDVLFDLGWLARAVSCEAALIDIVCINLMAIL